MRRFLKIIPLLFLLLGSLHAGFGTLSDPFGFRLQSKFLSPEEAFKAEAKLDGDRIRATIRLGEKIHIYARDLHFKIIKPESFELKVTRPAPVRYEGDDVYYGTLNVDIPLKEIRSRVSGPFTLEIDLTGCSDAGICYQPQKYTFDFPADAGAQSAKPKAQNSNNTQGSKLNAQHSSFSSGFQLKQKFLSPEEAFKVDAKVEDDAIVSTIRLGKRFTSTPKI